MNHLMSHLHAPSLTRRGRSIAAVAALAGLTLAGCSSSKSATPPSTSTTQPSSTSTTLAKPVACSLFLTSANVKTLFAAAPQQTKTETGPNGSKTCIYSWSSPTLVRSLVQSVNTGTAAYGEKILPNAKPITGLGEKAFVAQHSLANALIIQFVKDGKTYGVTYSSGGFKGRHSDASDQTDQLLAMMKAAAAKIS